MTASGRNLINPEVNRNERSPWVRNARKTVQWTVFSGERAAAPEGVATIEIADEPLTTASDGNFVNPKFFFGGATWPDT